MTLQRKFSNDYKGKIAGEIKTAVTCMLTDSTESLNECDFEEDLHYLPKDFKMEEEDYNKKLLNDYLVF